MSSKFTPTTQKQLLNQSSIMEMFDWLLCFTLKRSHDKLEKDLLNKKDQFKSRNDNQAYHAKTLSINFTFYA